MTTTYFIQNSFDKTIKIGKTKNIKSRFSALQGGCAHPLNLLATVNADVELDLHKMFSRDRLGGEWFNPSSDILSWISEHSEYSDVFVSQYSCLINPLLKYCDLGVIYMADPRSGDPYVEISNAVERAFTSEEFNLHGFCEYAADEDELTGENECECELCSLCSAAYFTARYFYKMHSFGLKSDFGIIVYNPGQFNLYEADEAFRLWDIFGIDFAVFTISNGKIFSPDLAERAYSHRAF